MEMIIFLSLECSNKNKLYIQKNFSISVWDLQINYITRQKYYFTIFAILKQNFDMISILIYLLAHFVYRSHELSVIIVTVVFTATVWLEA